MAQTWNVGTEFVDAYERNYRLIDIQVRTVTGGMETKFIISRLNEGIAIGQITCDYDDIRFCEITSQTL